ncbi:MAG: replicative DNA helicase [Proteobacteria bacterium]|nr:replicative DNA helicase [Cystobacterineae bacterium]MCL2314326.1 replicative DNA helicase [Pseudomonadota bacterium]
MPEHKHEDLNAERAVLGALLFDGSLLTSVAEILLPEDFAQTAHAEIFSAMLALELSHRPVDLLTIAEELKTRGKLTAVGGPAYLTSLDQGVPFAHNAIQYAKIVKEKATRRNLANVAKEIFQLASQNTGELDAIMDEAERKLFYVSDKRRSGDLVPMGELMDSALALLERLRKSDTGVTGLTTGFLDLDHLLTGFHPGELVVIAARPGVGKTSLAMNMALNVAKKENRTVGIFSLEMPSLQLVSRLLATTAKVDVKKLRGGRLSANDEAKLQEAAAELFQVKLYIDDTGALSSFDLRAKARRLKTKEPDLALLVIDYLQLMHQRGRVENRQLEVAEISRSLKQLAKELNVPVVALSQLSRKVEERKGGRPMLSDLRESGAIEQDADVVMFIHREDDNNEDNKSKTNIPMELIVAKQRNGPIGSVDLVFLSEYTRFESRAREWD